MRYTIIKSQINFKYSISGITLELIYNLKDLGINIRLQIEFLKSHRND